MTMSNRIAVMRHGRIEQVGPPEDVYEHPATEFVAGFLGASNLLDGEVKERRGGVATIRLAAGGTVRVPEDRMPADLDSVVKVGVRPEKISILPEGEEPPPDRNRVPGLLRMATYIGVSHQYKVEGPAGQELTVYVQNLGATPPPRPGERVQLVWKPEHTFVVRPSAPLSEEEEEV